MNGPLLWIGLPLAAACLLLLPRRGWTIAALGSLLALLLAVLALLLPVDQVIQFGNVSFKIAGGMDLFGRSLSIAPEEQPLLGLLYLLLAFWMFGSEAAGIARRLVPLGLAIAALLIASLAVEPFLYAALLIEMAVLLAVPMLAPPDQVPGRGVLRFLIYQTLAMPLVLFAGWLLAGVEASPGDLALAVQSAVLLGLGFALLLAIFPLYSWITLLAEETSLYALGFLLWILPTFIVLFGMGFLDRYTWLRTAEILPGVLRFGGLLMIGSGGVFAAFQRHLGRMLAYAIIVEIGLALLALGQALTGAAGVALTFQLIAPRAAILAVWSMGLAVLRPHVDSLRFHDVQGQARRFPLASAAILTAHFAASGLPLLAGLPGRLAVWEGLAGGSGLGSALWFGLGLIGLMIGGLRSLAVLNMAPAGTPWQTASNLSQRFLLGLGIFVLTLLGLFPQTMQIWLANLPAMFIHLGR